MSLNLVLMFPRSTSEPNEWFAFLRDKIKPLLLCISDTRTIFATSQNGDSPIWLHMIRLGHASAYLVGPHSRCIKPPYSVCTKVSIAVAQLPAPFGSLQGAIILRCNLGLLVILGFVHFPQASLRMHSDSVGSMELIYTPIYRVILHMQHPHGTIRVPLS